MTTATLRLPLERTRSSAIAGVGASLARHLGWPLGLTRAVLVVLAFAGGFGILFYLWLWALVPMERKETDAGVRRSIPVAAVLAAIALFGTLFVLAQPRSPLTLSLLIVAAAASAAVIWNLALDRADPSRDSRYSAIVRYSAAGAMSVAGIVKLFNQPDTVDAIISVGLIVLGVAVIVARRVVRLWTELLAERSTRARQEQRAEIAAHLHDSVLQTLALIQNRAGASSEVARIARAQERELRDWLFVGDTPVDVDLATEVREIAASIELDFAVRIDVVTAGEFSIPSAAVVAATREAMLNAARHVGGEVSVYIESTRGGVDVFVRDRGPGVDLDSLPSDRLGIRESIIGRMTRAGGSATVKPGAGGTGTEVHLHLEATP